MVRCMRNYGCGDTVTRTWVPGMKIFAKGGRIFFNDPNRIRSSVRKSNKKILPC
ncbi:MAG: hypothetical protein FD143_3573, partial [Ignavibacteria bacterium]